MRKSSYGGRPSVSGAPLRVINENAQSRRRSSSADRFSGGGPVYGGSKNRGRSSSGDRFSTGARLSFAGSKLPVLNQHKPSSSSNAFSFLPKSGRPSSGIGVRGRTDIPKDPRPVSDKRYQTQCIKQLLEFLTANSYPHPISQKILTSPSSKDFFRVFEFIYSKYSPGYKQVPKMEEEVPRVLKLLGYPFGLSKTYLFSVGSPHTWPHLLAALIWMINLLQMTESIKDHGGVEAFIFEPDDDSFDGISDEKIMFDYYAKTYTAFMEGQDTFENFDEELEQIFKQKYQGGNIEDIIAENARLEQEVQLLHQADERNKQLQERIDMSKHDAKELRTYTEKMQQYRKVLEGDLLKRKDERDIISSDLQAEREKLAGMQEIYERQDLTPADVDRLKAEQEGLRQQVDHLEKQIGNIDTDNWKITMEQAKLNEKVEMEVAAYNRLAIALKLVPETAKLANGRDFRLRSGFNSDIVASCESNIKPMLSLMKKKCKNNFHQKSKEKFQLAYEMEQFQETINERKEFLEQMAKDLASKEAEIESMKQILMSGKKVGEIEILKADLVQLETSLKQGEIDRARAAREQQATMELLSSKKMAVKKQLSEIQENHKKLRDGVMDYVNGMKAQLSNFILQMDASNSDMDKKIAQLQSEAKQREEWLKSIFKK